MVVRRELWCSSVVPAAHSKSAGYHKQRSTSAARIVLDDSSSKICGELVMAISFMRSFRPTDRPSQKHPSGDSAVCTNAVSRVVQRREVMKLCFFSGLFISELLQQNEAVLALERDGDGTVLPARAEVGLENGRLRSCEGSAPCVSTSAFRSPSRFMPPWQYLGSLKDSYEELLKALKRMGAEIMKIEEGRYVYATMSSSREDIVDLEFLFVITIRSNLLEPNVYLGSSPHLSTLQTRLMEKDRDFCLGKVVCFRSVSRKTALDPPFCWWPGCINGPRNRGWMEALRDDLGWIQLETDEEKVWTPIFLH